MGLIFSWSVDLTILCLTLLTILVLWIKNAYRFWSSKGVLAPPPAFLLGNTASLFTQRETFASFTQNVYQFIKNNGRQHGGCYFLWSPIYVPVDPEIVRNIMQRDFHHFVNRGVYFNEQSDPLSAHLFSLEDAKWKKLRTQMTPVFTSGKMKMMFETLVKCSDQLTIEMDKMVDKKSIDIKEILARFTIDIIGSCAFGLECNSLKDPDNNFYKYGKDFFEDSLWDTFVGICTFVAPGLMGKFGAVITPPHLTEFFIGVVQDTVNYRERDNIYRKDFMHLLIQLKNKGKLTDDCSLMGDDGQSNQTFTFNEIAAQAFVFFIAGFETSSTTMTFCLFELASNPEIQDKLRREIDSVLERHQNQLTYDALMEMTYMDKVIYETLRKYPPLPTLNRICTKDYKIPGSDFVIERGTKVFIPVIGLQRDELYYPDPDRFDPERFSEDNKRTRHPFTFIPFGEGPRICIGLRFGMMQTKVGLSVLIKNYKFTVSPKTAVPLVMDPKSFIMSTKGGIWLDCTSVK